MSSLPIRYLNLVCVVRNLESVYGASPIFDQNGCSKCYGEAGYQTFYRSLLPYDLQGLLARQPNGPRDERNPSIIRNGVHLREESRPRVWRVRWTACIIPCTAYQPPQ
jgi:hypothetical protein